MNNSNLSQITSEIPDFIGGLSKRRQPKGHAPPDEFDQYFDYKRFYEGTPAADADSRSRSDASSIPGLTSGPSEEDGAPSPRSTEDNAFHFKEAVEKIKQHDDRFTVPAREIRPNGVESYPWQMEIDNTVGSGGSDVQGFGGSSPHSPASSNGASSSAYHSSSSADSHLSRGKRHRPLDNPEKVAQMRKIGACFRCKTRKIPCDQQSPCSKCTTDAAKYGDDGELAEHMCFRRPSGSSELVFNVILRANVHTPAAPQRGNPQQWNVFFNPYPSAEPPLVISVSRDESNNLNNGQTWQTAHQYVFNPHCSPEDAKLIEWASWQMFKDDSSNFQSALDALLSKYAQEDHCFLPHHQLVRQVRDMRCMYRIWRQQKFFCQRFQNTPLEELPNHICQDLKRIMLSRMKALESTIMTQFWRILEKPHDRLPLWACMMQFILMYRDILNRSKDLCGDQTRIQSVTMSLFNNLIVMCEICFGKKKPEPMADDGNPIKRQLNADFKRVESYRDDFYQAIQDCVNTCPNPSTFDRLICILLIGSQRSVTRSGTRASKRAKR
ncbi:uncharacterized protein GGS22DRAFT_197578 [Annulohypoxylon maeteangense]|uniref:uncharacterized protein n=1 Tax=Annulohypoxylon maeteangense TaxID=1927788 RepID=UPI00200725E1|nr:uncharacterized protein GGS22DRAFT_197578 [Annulohypoxylon maeteangense]KAI0880386.1 hypothetical protein GGS22DRAFT_197578 [Annulohypoxylon maeteangense]